MGSYRRAGLLLREIAGRASRGQHSVTKHCGNTQAVAPLRRQTLPSVLQDVLHA